MPFPSFRRAVAAAAVAFALAGCSNATEPGRAPGLLTRLPRDLTPAEQKLIDASNAFSFALWHQVSAAQHDSNVFISPLSASFALGMTMDGAANRTFDEMRTALQLEGLSQADINGNYKSLIALLTSLDPGVTMQVANSIWYRQDFPFEQAFLDDARTYFDAEVRGLNFDDVNGSLNTINGWVSDKTNQKITRILDGINPNDVMYLINALYFKGSWRARFDSSSTVDSRFTTADGTEQAMRLMQRRDTMSYAATASYQAVDLPYGNGAFTMTVVLPGPGVDIDAFSDSLTQSKWKSLTAGLSSADLELGLPKFRLSYDRRLNDDLKALGMRVPFVPDSADFTRMSPLGKQLYVSFVKQKTFVDVNEQGTEAAAVTAVGITVTSVGPSHPVMYVTRPFLFVIRERLSGTVLFMGKVVRLPAE